MISIKKESEEKVSTSFQARDFYVLSYVGHLFLKISGRTTLLCSPDIQQQGDAGRKCLQLC